MEVAEPVTELSPSRSMSDPEVGLEVFDEVKPYNVVFSFKLANMNLKIAGSTKCGIRGLDHLSLVSDV